MAFMGKPLLAAALLGSPSFAVIAAQGQHALAGVLEDVQPGNLSPGMTGPHVRLSFEYKNSHWNAFQDKYPPQVTWTVVFDGRLLGTIVSRIGAGIKSLSSRPIARTVGRSWLASNWLTKGRTAGFSTMTYSSITGSCSAAV
jgi:hypothetical protein